MFCSSFSCNGKCHEVENEGGWLLVSLCRSLCCIFQKKDYLIAVFQVEEKLLFRVCRTQLWSPLILDFIFYFFKFYFIFKLYITVLVLPNIKMNPPQVYMCSPSWTLLPSPSPFHQRLRKETKMVTT